MKKLLLLILTVVAAVSCSKITDPTIPHDRLKSLLLGKDTLQMYEGENRQVSLNLSPSNYILDSIKWSSSDSTVLSVTNGGLLKAKKIGYSKITVSNFANTVSVTCSVSVTDSLKVGLIAYYPFAGNAVDSTGRGHNGTVSGATTTTDRNGVANAAYYFDGATSSISVPDSKDLRLGNTSFTINAWVQIQQYDASYGSIIIDKRGNNAYDGWNFGIAGYADLTNQVQAVGVMTYAVSGGDAPFVKGATQLDFTKWHMTTVMYNAIINQVTLYIDGKADGSIPIAAPNFISDAPMYIGADNPNVTNSYFFKGKIDDIRIYKRALRPGELQKLYTISN